MLAMRVAENRTVFDNDGKEEKTWGVLFNRAVYALCEGFF